MTAHDPKTLLNSTLTVRSAYADNATYQNDMTFIKLTPTGKTARGTPPPGPGPVAVEAWTRPGPG